MPRWPIRNWLKHLQGPEAWQALQSRKRVRFSLAILIPFFFCLLQSLLWPLLDPTYFILFFPAVMLTCLLTGLSGGTVATGVSAAFANYFFMPPAFSFTISDVAATQLLVFGLNCLLICVVTDFLAFQYRKLIATRLDETLGRMGEGLVSLDRGLRHSFVNSAFSTMMGLPREAFLGKTPWELFPHLRGTEFERRVVAALRTGRGGAFTHHDETKDRWFDVNVYPTSSGVTLFVTNITEREKARLDLEKKTDEAVEANERLRWTNAELKRSNDELAQFAHVASHDMKEPLRMISNYVMILERQYSDKLDETARSFIGFAAEGAKRLHALLNDILAYSKIQSETLDYRPIELSHCLREALEQLRGSIAESGARVRADELPVVQADHRQLVRVFQNLVGNAIKFRRAGIPPNIEVTAVEEPGCWRICVKDDGIGVEPHQRENIFELFKRGHSQAEYPGSGIGLATCKKIIERAGGRIWVESEVGQNTVFCFTLLKDAKPNLLRFQAS